MNAAGIERSNLAGIPSQVWRHTNERKYYANSTNNIAYRDHDFALAAQYEQLTPEQRQQVDLTITGIDVTNGPAIGQELDIRLRAHPRVFAGVGEVTLIKEIVSDKNPHRPDIGSDDTQTLLIEATKRGLPVILHNDRSVPSGKNKYAGQMVAAIREWAERMTRFGNEQDPLKLRPGVDPATVPAMKPRLIWAHAAGMSRFTGESNHHTRDLDELLSDPTLADIVHLDLSWDFVVNDILQNLYDQLTRHNVAPGLRQGLQNVLKLYRSFTVLGGLADKADDLGDVNLASLYRVGAETITAQYFAALADFQHRVRQAFNDPATRAVFTELLAEHGQRGNNWLYIMAKHSDRLMFGTDALAVGIKAHGDAAYAMNARIMYPLFDILDQAAAHHLPDTAGITDKIGRTNYEKIFHDPQITARRHAWEDYLAAEKTAEHSAQVQPQQFTTSHANPLLAAKRAQRVTDVMLRYEDLKTSRVHKTESGRWTDDRAQLHQRIVDEVYSRYRHVPTGRTAVFAAGSPAAGKSTVLRDHAGFDPSNFIPITPDDMKEELIRHGGQPSIPARTI